MEETWKVISDLKNYEISNMGRVRNIKTHRVLKTRISKLGYEQLTITYLGKKHFRTIHRLVAFAFVDNPHDKLEVNHIDEDKLNNTFNNLEWVTRKENLNHGSWISKKIKSREIPILAIKSGIVTEYESTKAFAEKHGVQPTSVTQALKKLNKNGTKKTLKGYTFKYKEV